MSNWRDGLLKDFLEEEEEEEEVKSTSTSAQELAFQIPVGHDGARFDHSSGSEALISEDMLHFPTEQMDMSFSETIWSGLGLDFDDVSIEFDTNNQSQRKKKARRNWAVLRAAVLWSIHRPPKRRHLFQNEQEDDSMYMSWSLPSRPTSAHSNSPEGMTARKAVLSRAKENPFADVEPQDDSFEAHDDQDWRKIDYELQDAPFYRSEAVKEKLLNVYMSKLKEAFRLDKEEEKKRLMNAEYHSILPVMNPDILSGIEAATSAKPKEEIYLELGQHRFLNRRIADNRNKEASQQDGGLHASIKPKDQNYLVNSFKVKLESAFQSERKRICGASTSFFGEECCIYRVEEKFQELSRRAYIPDLVSIGPFHRGKGNLPAMEQHKLLYLRNFLTRATTTTTEWSSILKECVESLKSIEEEARKCYSEPINLSSNEFVEMMLVDGFFIIELFRKNAGEVSIDRDDPFFNNSFNLSTLIHDLVLLENQLPMLVLNCLSNMPTLHRETHHSSITTLALNFFNPLMPRDKKVLEQYDDCEGKHLLDLLGKTFLLLPSRSQTTNNSWKTIPAATELKTAGFKFMKSSKMGSFLDIKFSDSGVLKIPPVIIEDQNATLLRNLLALEQCSGGSDTYMTSYVILMKSIINSASDVGFLRKQGIITGDLCIDEDFSNIFNELSCGLNTLRNFYYSEFCDQVNTHYKNKILWNVQDATLNRAGNCTTFMA